MNHETAIWLTCHGSLLKWKLTTANLATSICSIKKNQLNFNTI